MKTRSQVAKGPTPNARSVAFLRKAGWTAEVVEWWNAHSRTRHDLFGIADVLAFDECFVLAVQATAGGHAALRRKKAEADPRLLSWLEEYHRRFQVHEWRMAGARGKRKLWTVAVWEAVLIEGAIEWRRLDG